jgi:hypothetical protein
MTLTAWITFIVAGVGGLFLGIVAGWHNAELASEAMQSADILSASSVTSNFALQQFEHADTAHARQAVTLQIKTLEQLERVPGDWVSKSELGYAYTRLAMIEEAAGAPEAEYRAMVQAKEYFNRAYSGHEPTDEQLKNSLKRFDQGFDRLETAGHN